MPQIVRDPPQFCGQNGRKDRSSGFLSARLLVDRSPLEVCAAREPGRSGGSARVPGVTRPVAESPPEHCQHAKQAPLDNQWDAEIVPMVLQELQHHSQLQQIGQPGTVDLTGAGQPV
ncbi:MAG: hypothetical protein M3014_00385 [Chloroflexota bacterium]|nr:hypothetical protein [Chloroflexota bacterium]